MRILTGLLLLLLTATMLAQDPTPPAGMEGLALRNWLRSNWYLPWHDDLGYSDAREAMYGTIDNEGGQIECVYTGFTQPAEETSFPDPINTEHTVPQSFFNSQVPMRSDIHHLFPTHGQANGDRGSLPYDEVVDNQADEWLIVSGGNYSSSNNVPSSNIDAYSEVHHNVAFEPREENKGNIARAVMYFYTMYANDVEAQYSDISAVCDLQTIYNWHVMDQPDAEEIERDEQTQSIQGNYNPYIRMPELAGPAWGFASSVSEYTLDVQLIQDADAQNIEMLGMEPGMHVSVIDILGQQTLAPSAHHIISTNALPRGVYFLILTDTAGRRGVRKVVVE